MKLIYLAPALFAFAGCATAPDDAAAAMQRAEVTCRYDDSAADGQNYKLCLTNGEWTALENQQLATREAHHQSLIRPSTRAN